MDKVVKAVIGMAVGWAIEQIAADVLRDMGVPPHTAKVAGAIVGVVV